MKKCPKCGLPVMDGVVVCDCGYVLKAVFGMEAERGKEPDVVSSEESLRNPWKEPVPVSRPIRKDARKPAVNHWERWLIIIVFIMAFRAIMNFQTDEPLIQPSSPPSFTLTDQSLLADFSLSPASGRLEQLQRESREILRRYLTPEEYDLLIETGRRRDQNGVAPEDLNRAAALMTKVRAMATAEERATLAELEEVARRPRLPAK